MLTHDVLLELVVVLGLAVVLGLGGTFLHRLAARRRAKPARRLSLLPHLSHEGGLRAVVSKRAP
jgi:hypothetical protein